MSKESHFDTWMDVEKGLHPDTQVVAYAAIKYFLRAYGASEEDFTHILEEYKDYRDAKMNK